MAGVSQSAPCNHFADRKSLWVVLSTKGFRRLDIDLEEAIASIDPVDSAACIQPLGRAFRPFAERHTNLLGLMFGGNSPVPPRGG
ncbi:MAG: hypothetical protein J4G09_05930 [Proteobacteria bacterium]|nr:hypothetical protein [Pseudomonadota bacterium]